MKKPIRRVAVIGAGVMGGGIAAHIANAGIPVLLVDIVPPNLSGADKDNSAARNQIAQNALKALLKSKPASFYRKAQAELVSIGNLEDDLAEVANCDLVIEAVIERLDIKQKLFERLENLGGPDTIFASNTSGLRISEMLEGRGAEFKKRFLVMHFFNPPRYMKLLELVAGPDTDSDILEAMEQFGRDILGKGIVHAKDSPNFVANRIGAHSMMTTIHQMLEQGLAPEDVDAITGLPMGHPKSATFRTGDLVGLDTLAHVVKNCHHALTDDEDREVFTIPDYIVEMLEKKRLGNKTKGGFYRKTKEGIETFDPTDLDYRPRGGNEEIKKTAKGIAKEEDVRARVRKLANDDSTVGKFAWSVLSRSLAYAARRIGEISDDIAAIDAAMRWGYNWELGPFETWDAIGFADVCDRMKKDGISLPEPIEAMHSAGVSGFYNDDGDVYDPKAREHKARDRDEREATLTILKREESAVVKNGGGEAWDIGDGVLAVRFRSKANSIDPNVIALLNDSVERAEQDFRGMLITNDGEHFCVGANLFLVVMAAQQKNWDQIRDIVRSFQAVNQRMKYASVPVVAAPFGMTLGGGLEICYGCDAVQAAAETYSGLVEVGVGLIPGGGGTLNMLWRGFESIPGGVEYDSYAFVTQAFKNIATARVATSAPEGVEFGYFRSGDGVSFDRARQLWEAKQLTLGLAGSGYHPPAPRTYKLPGESGIATLQMFINTMVAGGFASEHDAKVGGYLARVLCGGAGGGARKVTEEEILELECEAFISLCGEKKSQERMQHMLMHNKPLRN